MTNPNNCAFPTGSEGDPGLTIREYFAAVAMQGLIAGGMSIYNQEGGANLSVLWADALIKELNSTP
jgi:hypothetical protein